MSARVAQTSVRIQRPENLRIFSREPVLSWMSYQEFRECWNRRELIFEWSHYLDAFNNYAFHIWLSSVYRGHYNWYTRSALFTILSYQRKVLTMPTSYMNRIVSQCFEPNSHTTLIVYNLILRTYCNPMCKESTSTCQTFPLL